MDPADLRYRPDDDDLDPGPAYEVFLHDRPVGRVEWGWVPSGEPDRRCRGWQFEHVDGRLGTARTRHGAVLDGFAQRSYRLTPA